MNKLISIFRIPELRNKILFTIGLLAIYRLGFWVPLPIINQEQLQTWADQQLGGDMSKMMQQLSMFSGTDLGTSTIFGLGIMPYISASIIFQLLASVVPALEKLQKEGEVGRKKINEYTRYATVVICLIQSAFWVNYLWGLQVGGSTSVVADSNKHFFYGLISVVAMTAGTVFLMWIGEQIDEYGIGNGISLIIMAGIVGRIPAALKDIYHGLQEGEFQISPVKGIGVEKIVLLAFLFVAVIWAVIVITQGQRRIPTQSARHLRGRRVFGGNPQYLPLRVNQAGVMPIIFASSLLMFPTLILGWLSSVVNWDWLHAVVNSFRGHGYLYTLFYIALIYFFCYFWTAITFNPKDMANHLKDVGSFIPGYRPGKRTADYLEKVMLRITYVGAAFLAVVAIAPTLLTSALDIKYTVASFFGGTGMLIVISVALDLVQKIDSHLIMRNYDSLLGPSENK